MALKKLLQSNMKIRFHDCDPFNHLNNSRYIDYMMTARTDQILDNYGLDIYSLASEKGIAWVTAQTQISYIVPAYLAEEVVIQTQLIGFSEKSLQFEALMWNKDTTVLKAVMWTRLVHFNLHTQKSHAHSAALMELFSAVVPTPGDAADFETRIKNLKTLKQ